MAQPGDSGAVRGLPRAFLRVEGLVLLALSIIVYAEFGRSWWLFVILLLVPDVGILGYLRGTRVGAVVYNVFHTYLPPAALMAIGILVDDRLLVSLALIWFAHIGLDRALGYGLKYPDGFQHTHLGRIRKRPRR